MKKTNIARRALEKMSNKMGIGKRNSSEATTQIAEPAGQQSTVFQAPQNSTNLQRKMKRRHISNFARQCAEYISQALAKRKEARAAKIAGR